MGNFLLAGERESRGVEEKRNYLGSTWKWIADRVKSRTEEALDTMAEGKGDMKLKLEIQMQIETDKRLVNPKQPTRWPLMVFLRFIEEISSRRTDSLDNLAACWKWNVWKWLIKCGYNFSISSPASSTSITLLAFTCCRGKEYFAIYFFIWAWDFGFGFVFGFGLGLFSRPTANYESTFAASVFCFFAPFEFSSVSLLTAQVTSSRRSTWRMIALFVFFACSSFLRRLSASHSKMRST